MIKREVYLAQIKATALLDKKHPIFNLKGKKVKSVSVENDAIKITFSNKAKLHLLDWNLKK